MSNSFLSPGHVPDPGMEPTSSLIAGRFFTTKPPGEDLCNSLLIPNKFIIAGEISGYVLFRLNVLETCTGTSHNFGADEQKSPVFTIETFTTHCFFLSELAV